GSAAGRVPSVRRGRSSTSRRHCGRPAAPREPINLERDMEHPAQTTTTSPDTGPGSARRSARIRRRWLGVGSTLGLVGALSVSAVHADVTLGPRVDYPVQNSPREAVLADFDGDGDLDSAVANAFSKSVSILTNDGTGA